jgi:hypothetical protein
VPHWLHSLLHWLQWGTVPAWIAALVSGLSAYYSWRSQRKAGEQANRATDAAVDAVRAQKEIAGETKRLADITEQRFDAAEQSPWDIQPDGGSGRYRIINKRDTPKYEVYLSGDRVIPGRTNDFRFIDRGESKSIYLQDSGVVNRTVTVSWHPTSDHSGERLRQRLEP